MRVKFNSKPLSLENHKNEIFLGTFDGSLFQIYENNEIKKILTINCPIAAIQIFEPKTAKTIFSETIILGDWHGNIHFIDKNNLKTEHKINLRDDIIKSMILHKNNLFVSCNSSIFVIDVLKRKKIKTIELENCKALCFKIIQSEFLKNYQNKKEELILGGLNNSYILIIEEDLSYEIIDTPHSQSISYISEDNGDIFTSSLDGSVRKNLSEVVFSGNEYVFQYERGFLAVKNKLIKEKVIFEGVRNIGKFIFRNNFIYCISYDGALFVNQIYEKEDESSEL